jgi:polyisoprenoid-binding protein YceI
MKTTLFAILLSFIFTKPTEIYVVDTAASNIGWTGYYLFSFGEHTGDIKLSKGELQFSGDQLTGGSFIIDMKSITNSDMEPNNGGNDLVEHLKNDDFFAVNRFPEAKFVVTKVEKISDAQPRQPNVDITGALTIKDVTETLKFPATVISKSNTITATAKFKFDRTKWNVRYNSGKFFSDVGDGAISDAIGLSINITAHKKSF